MESQNFNLSDHFESTKNKFIENLSLVYGHPHSLIDAELKDGTNDVVILKFNIESNAQKDLLLEKMKNLIGNENKKMMATSKSAPHGYKRFSEPVYLENSGEMILYLQFLQ